MKYKLAHWNIPVRTYLLFESLVLLILAHHFPLYLGFAQSEVNLLPLVVALLSAIYGYQAGLRGVFAYMLLYALGLPFIEGSGWDKFMHHKQIGFFIGLIPCSLIAASLATFHWDRRWWLAIPMLTLALWPVYIFQSFIANLWQPSFDLFGALLWALLAVTIQVIIGAITLIALWRMVENYLDIEEEL